MCAERWQKPDPDNPGHTIGQSVMEQFSFRYGANELWLGVGVTAAWTVVMAGATFLASSSSTVSPPCCSQLLTVLQPLLHSSCTEAGRAARPCDCHAACLSRND